MSCDLDTPAAGGRKDGRAGGQWTVEKRGRGGRKSGGDGEEAVLKNEGQRGEKRRGLPLTGPM